MRVLAISGMRVLAMKMRASEEDQVSALRKYFPRRDVNKDADRILQRLVRQSSDRYPMFQEDGARNHSSR